MEHFYSLHQLPCPQMEPVAQLAPYLSDLDVCDAVKSFSRLADKLLSHPLQTQPQSTGDSAAGNNSLWAPISQSITNYQEDSTSGQRVSFCGSPALSDQSIGSPSPAPFNFGWSLSTCSSVSSSSSSSFFSSTSGSGPASVASSCGSSSNQDQPSPSSQSIGEQRGTRRGHRKSTAVVGERRQKNASAAEKYRRRLKGREWSLAQEMEREQERNSRLRRQLEAKLSLYREFVALLAQNTGSRDAELAQFGSNSLGSVFSEVLGSATGSGQQQQQQQSGLGAEQDTTGSCTVELLSELLNKFKGILAHGR